TPAVKAGSVVLRAAPIFVSRAIRSGSHPLGVWASVTTGRSDGGKPPSLAEPRETGNLPARRLRPSLAVYQMRAVSRIAPYVLLLAFAAWCAIALRGDLAQLSLAPLLHS